MRYLICLILFLFVSCSCSDTPELETNNPVLLEDADPLPEGELSPGYVPETSGKPVTEEELRQAGISVPTPREWGAARSDHWEWYLAYSYGTNDLRITLGWGEVWPYRLRVQTYVGGELIFGPVTEGYSSPSLECIVPNPGNVWVAILVAWNARTEPDFEFMVTEVEEAPEGTEGITLEEHLRLQGIYVPTTEEWGWDGSQDFTFHTHEATGEHDVVILLTWDENLTSGVTLAVYGNGEELGRGVQIGTDTTPQLECIVDNPGETTLCLVIAWDMVDTSIDFDVEILEVDVEPEKSGR